MNHIPRSAPLRRIMREAAMSTENTPPLTVDAASSPTSSVATNEQVSSEEQRRVWKSDDLLGPETEALILHRGQTYRLRCTKQGKLILYK
jgi:hemin uptake protein HemP